MSPCLPLARLLTSQLSWPCSVPAPAPNSLNVRLWAIQPLLFTSFHVIPGHGKKSFFLQKMPERWRQILFIGFFFFWSPLPYLIHEISFIFNSRMPAKWGRVSILPPTIWWLGSPSNDSCVLPPFLSTWAQMKNQKFHPILQALLSIQMSRCFFFHGGTPVFSMEFSPHYFHFSLHSTVPGHRQSLCWCFRKDVKASGRLCTHRQILGHSGWLLKHQDHNQTQPLIAESKVSSNWLKEMEMDDVTLAWDRPQRWPEATGQPSALTVACGVGKI